MNYNEKIEQVKDCINKAFDYRLTGKRVRLIEMIDKYAPAPDTMGTIKYIDSIGQIHVNWDNGSTLAIAPTEDKYQIFD